MKIQDSSVYKAVTTVAKSVYKALSSEVSVLVFAGTNILKGLQGVGVFALDNARVKLALSIGTLVKSAFETFATVPKMHEVSVLRTDLFEIMKSGDAKKTCTYIRDNQKQIRNILGVAKNAGILKRAEDVLADKVAPEKAEEFLTAMRRRVNLQFGVNLTKLITRVANVGASIALVSTPTSPVSLAITGLCGVATLGLWAFEKVFLPSNPFDAPKDIWYETIPHKIRSTAFKISDTIATFFAEKSLLAAS